MNSLRGRDAPAPYKTMIIDVHSHDFPDQIAVRAMNGMCRMTEGNLWPSGDGTLLNHLDSMELAGVDKAVSCPIATKPHMFEGLFRRACQIKDGELGPRVQRMIIPFASVHPLDPEVMSQLGRIAAAGLKGVKFHCYYQDFSLANKDLWPVFAKIADLGLVVQCHCGADISWKDLKGLCGPREIAILLKNVRGLKFIAAHLGGCDGYPPHDTDQVLECGAYIDTSVLHRRWHYDEPMRVLSWPRDRILFGTDFPWVQYSEAIRWVKSVRDPKDWSALFGDNACRLLSI